MRIDVRPDERSSEVYRQVERDGSVREKTGGVGHKKERMRYRSQSRFRKCGISVQVMGRLTQRVEWRPRRTRFLDCLVVHSSGV